MEWDSSFSPGLARRDLLGMVWERHQYEGMYRVLISKHTLEYLQAL